MISASSSTEVSVDSARPCMSPSLAPLSGSACPQKVEATATDSDLSHVSTLFLSMRETDRKSEPCQSMILIFIT